MRRTRLQLALAASLCFVITGLALFAGQLTCTRAAEAPAPLYDGPTIARFDAHEIGPVAAGTAVLSDAQERSVSPPAERSGSSATSSSSFVATNRAGAIKGAIPDAVPANLTQQLALAEARASGGAQILANLADRPRLVAVYGEGEWVKP